MRFRRLRSFFSRNEFLPGEEALDDGRSQVILEWAEYLPPQLLPEEYLDISVDACEKGRLLTLTAHGPRAEALLRQTCGQWPGGEA